MVAGNKRRSARACPFQINHSKRSPTFFPLIPPPTSTPAMRLSPEYAGSARNRTPGDAFQAFHSTGSESSLPGRLTSHDPIEEQGGLNLYGFVGNGPVGRWDVLGMSPNARLEISLRNRRYFGDEGIRFRLLVNSDGTIMVGNNLLFLNDVTPTGYIVNYVRRFHSGGSYNGGRNGKYDLVEQLEESGFLTWDTNIQSSFKMKGKRLNEANRVGAPGFGYCVQCASVKFSLTYTMPRSDFSRAISAAAIILDATPDPKLELAENVVSLIGVSSAEYAAASRARRIDARIVICADGAKQYIIYNPPPRVTRHHGGRGGNSTTSEYGLFYSAPDDASGVRWADHDVELVDVAPSVLP